MSERNDRIPLKGGDEQDALTIRRRRFYGPTAGVVRKLKQSYNRRRRREVRKEIAAITEGPNGAL